ncbi:unnamed protein product [Aureobasidium vineae]|uniref:Uncharacterized protein n=1 Tax=Aureobasidium vineae TaxID=2773715 RepID=A0A9N8JPR9_9PEZI|nr:unnamed protein product [Aureobasidium vineae]
MWATLSRATGLSLRKSFVSIESRLFSVYGANLVSLSTDPAKRRQQLDALNLRRRTDPEWHRQELIRRERYRRRNAAKLSDYNSQYNKSFLPRYTSDPTVQLSQRLQNWVKLHVWVREELPWKTHRPVRYETPTPRRCEFCGITRRNGLHLVWQRIAQPDLYSCHRCYARQGTETCLPTGYEDIRGIKELAARKKQLEQPKSGSP